MQKDYYLILGVSTNASTGEVKAAFRRRALELHPDRSGLGSEPFQQLQEAYAVLSDPDRRRRYDQQRGAEPVRRRPWGPAPEPIRAPGPAAEPLTGLGPVRGWREVALAESFETYRPSFEELFDRWWSNFARLDRPKAERLESLTVEMLLSPAQARAGGQVRVWVPARATCSTCGGRGAVGLYECWRCQGHGALTAEYPVDVRYPPGITDGYAVRVPLERFGIENFYLTVLFRVG